MSAGWIGVDFDGTLAVHGKWQGPSHAGAPIMPMVERVKRWRAEGIEVRILTARVARIVPEAERTASWLAILSFCERYIGEQLPVTSEKDYGMLELWDDRAVRVVLNTGERCCGPSA